MAGEAVVVKELFGDEDGDDGLAETYDIRKEETAVFLEHEESLLHRIHLVGKAHEAFGHVRFTVRVVLDGGTEILDEQFDVDLEWSEIVAKMARAGDREDILRQDLDALLPEGLELGGGELDILEGMEEDVEFVVAANLFDAESGGGEVRRTGDDGAGFVLVEALRDEEVDFRVEPLRGMGADLDFLRGNVLCELKNARLDLGRVSGRRDVRGEAFAELPHGPARVGQKEPPLAVILLHDLIDVDADEKADLGHLLEVWTDREVSGRSQVAHKGVEAFDIRVVLEDARELLQQGVVACVGEESGGHSESGKGEAEPRPG